jgi:SH3 domain-containing YSC84-like protein 1
MKRFISCLLLVTPLFAEKEVDEHTKRIQESAVVLKEIMNAGDSSIPQDLLEKAQCVGVVPNLKHGGFIVGGKYGKGVRTCRLTNSLGWSAPSTIRVEGGSIGFQIGAGETDLVFAVMNQRGMEKLMKDKFTVGADAGVMAGPVGRSAAARTDAMMHAEILAWSRSRGVFAGISLEGATLRPDNDDNEKIYHRAVTQEEILHGKVTPPASANALYTELNTYAPFKKS